MPGTVVIGRDDLIKLIVQSELYPADSPLIPVGLAVKDVWEAYTESARSSCCGPKPQILFPALDVLFSLLREQTDAGDAARTAFKAYLTNKKGFEVATVMLYFRRGKEPHPEKLEF